jgi:hypothetical protein
MIDAGYVTHGTDRALWAFRVPDLTESQIGIARTWLTRVEEETAAVESAGKPLRGPKDILILVSLTLSINNRAGLIVNIG